MISSKEYKFMILYYTKQWINGAIFQGLRFLKAIDHFYSYNETMAAPPPDDGDSLFTRRDSFSMRKDDILVHEDEFFLHSIERLTFFLDKAGEFYTEFSDYAKLINNAAGNNNIRDVRNMRIHIDEYLKNGGYYKQRFIHYANINNPHLRDLDNHSFAGDATSTYIKKDQYLIGSRIPSQAIMGILMDIQSKVNNDCSRYMNEVYREQD